MTAALDLAGLDLNLVSSSLFAKPHVAREDGTFAAVHLRRGAHRKICRGPYVSRSPCGGLWRSVLLGIENQNMGNATMQRNTLTFTAYARHRGVAVSSISRAVARGDIPVVVVDGERRIDPFAADAARAGAPLEFRWDRRLSADASRRRRAQERPIRRRI